MKKLTKPMALIAALIMLVAMVASCGSSTADQSSAPSSDVTSVERTTVNIATLKGPTGIGMTWLLDSADKGTSKNDYKYTIASAADDITGKLVSGAFDIAALPTNAAAMLYKKTNGGVKLLSLKTLGVLYILENGDSVKSVADLKGKTIGASGQGAVPEFVLDYVLEKNGIDPEKDVTVKWYDEHSELAAQMLSGKVSVAIVPEPFVTTITMQDSNIKVALDMNAEWDKVADCTLSMGCIVVRTEFAEKNPDAVKAFIDEYTESVKKANNDIDSTADLCVKYEIVPKAPVAKSAIPRCNMVTVTGKEMKDQIAGFYELLNDFKPGLIGGGLPDDSFYYSIG